MYRKIVVLIISLVILFTAGCWSKRELDELAIVLGVALDKAPEKGFKLTVEVARPEAMGAGGTGGGGGQQPPVLILSTEGPTVFEAVRQAVTINSRKLYFSHNQIILWGEDLAKAGVRPVIDFFERDPELRTEVPIVVTSGSAGDILMLPLKLEKSNSASMHEALKTADAVSRILNTQYHDFLLAYNGKITAPVVPYVKIFETAGLQTYRFAGMAVFKDDKMVGKLNPQETRGLLWVRGEVKDGVDAVKGHGAEKYYASFEVTKSKAEIKADIREGKPLFKVQVELYGNLGELQYPIDITKPENVAALERNMEKTVVDQINKALSKAQKKLKVDIFGFGEKMRISRPKEWSKIKDKWDKVFPKVQVKVSVKARMIHSGEKTKPSHVIN